MVPGFHGVALAPALDDHLTLFLSKIELLDFFTEMEIGFVAGGSESTGFYGGAAP
ncbi:MAG: hypothetical protein QNK83_12050 [Akkermansiaceae bacterium]